MKMCQTHAGIEKGKQLGTNAGQLTPRQQARHPQQTNCQTKSRMPEK